MTTDQYNELCALKSTIEDATTHLELFLTGLRRAPVKEYRSVERAMRLADNAYTVLEDLCIEIEIQRKEREKYE